MLKLNDILESKQQHMGQFIENISVSHPWVCANYSHACECHMICVLLFVFHRMSQHYDTSPRTETQPGTLLMFACFVEFIEKILKNTVKLRCVCVCVYVCARACCVCACMCVFMQHTLIHVYVTEFHYVCPSSQPGLELLLAALDGIDRMAQHS